MIYDIQKASLTKRFSAFLLDFILLSILAVGFVYLLSLATGLDGYATLLSSTYDKIEAEYGVDFGTTEDQYNAMSEADRENYNAAYDALVKELEENGSYVMTYSTLLICLSIGLLLAFVVLEFVVPLFLKNGQTVGMKVFGIGVVFNNSVRVNTFAMFARSILGKYTCETMAPILIVVMILFNTIGTVGLVLLLALLILQICLFAFNKNRTFIHDIISNTVAVDMATQMIFDNYAELVAFKEELSKEASQKAKY